MKPLPLVCVLSLLLFSFEESAARASPEKMGVPAQGVSQDAPGAQGTAVEVLRGFQTYYLEIDTIFLEHPVIEQALAKRPEFQAWGLTRTTEPGVADVVIQFTLPALTWQWNYKLIHGSTGQLLGFGRVTALEEHEASALLAADIVSTIRIARGTAEIPGTRAVSTGVSPNGAKKWNVKGGGRPVEVGKDLTLSITRDSIFISGPKITAFEIPTRNLLYVYHLELQNAQHRLNVAELGKGWDEACGITTGNDCLALVGLPLYLISESILSVSDSGPSHYVVLQVHDGEAVSEMSFLTSAANWPGLISDLQSVIPGKEQRTIDDAKQLRKGFEAAKEHAVQILLQVPVEVGRWPTLEPGDYRLVINEHGEGRADVFFYKLPSVDFTKPRAVATAQAAKLSPPMPDSKITFIEKGGVRFFDEVRVGGYLLHFD